MIIAVMVPRCSSISGLSSLPPIVDEYTLEMAERFLRTAFRVPWPHTN